MEQLNYVGTGASPVQSSEARHLAVVTAAQSGDLKALDRLLAEDASAASARDEVGVSALMHALYRRQGEAFERLLAANPKLDVFEATSIGRLDDLKELLRGDPGMAKAFSSDGFTALHFAAFFSQPQAAELLLNRGADANAVARNPMQVTPLHSAAAARSLLVAKLLLQHGALTNARQQGGWTPLHAASQHGDLAMAELLLSFGADKSLENDDGLTAAALAKKFGQAALIGLV
jgi:ankyrin repeat protein